MNATKHADDPQVGDVWSEMLSHIGKVIAVGPDVVVIQWREKRETMTRAEFAKYMRYDTPNLANKTWAECWPAMTADEITCDDTYAALAANW